MESHLSLSDQKFIHKFKAATLPPSLFNHEAHLRLAWLNIKRFGIKDGIVETCQLINAYVIALDAENKFNKTLTVAATKAVYHFMLKSELDSFEDFIDTFKRLKFNFKELMAAHYSFDIYNSEFAKKNYLAPDLLPFD
ncbi:hypothetical protein [uncultured Croceitalea sp.]|uniref:hypothetical protein n=1 Tax=uncultured Croceitalea sp. TaxID=1798908 RepID=UPI00330675F8